MATEKETAVRPVTLAGRACGRSDIQLPKPDIATGGIVN
jgi:hypothetical protein